MLRVGWIIRHVLCNEVGRVRLYIDHGEYMWRFRLLLVGVEDSLKMGVAGQFGSQLTPYARACATLGDLWASTGTRHDHSVSFTALAQYPRTPRL